MNDAVRWPGSGRTAPAVWCFGRVEFDEDALELRLDGVPVELEAKPLRLLMALLDRSGRVVSKDELLALVWPGASVLEGSLTAAVSKLRRAIGDHEQTAIVTVPRIGYRFDGKPIRRSAPVERSSEPMPVRRDPRPRLPFIATAAVAMLVGAGAALFVRGGRT